MDDALATALNPVCISGETFRADIPGVEVGGVTRLAMTQPQFFFFAFFPIKIGFRLGNGSRNWWRGLLLGHVPLLLIVY